MNIRPPKPPKKIKISEGMIENLNNVTYELGLKILLILKLNLIKV